MKTPNRYHLTHPSQNVSKAQAEIDRLEAEAADEAAAGASATNAASSNKGRSHDNSKKPAQHNAGVNGDANAEAQLKQEVDATKDVAEELEAAKIEDGE